MSLSDNDIEFEGLEDYLEEIRATDAHYVTQWDSNKLRNLKRLQLIDVNYTSFGAIEYSIPELTELRFLGLIKREIAFIIDYAFADLKSLKVFNVNGNLISEMK